MSLNLSCVSLVYSKKDNHRALDNVNMTAKRGHIYGLLGPSGCGKTSVLKVFFRKKIS